MHWWSLSVTKEWSWALHLSCSPNSVYILYGERWCIVLHCQPVGTCTITMTDHFIKGHQEICPILWCRQPSQYDLFITRLLAQSHLISPTQNPHLQTVSPLIVVMLLVHVLHSILIYLYIYLTSWEGSWNKPFTFDLYCLHTYACTYVCTDQPMPPALYLGILVQRQKLQSQLIRLHLHYNPPKVALIAPFGSSS